MPSRRTVFDLFLCLSLANLWFLRVWAQLLPAVVNHSNLYYMDAAPHWIHYPAVLASLGAVGVAACAIVAWGRRDPEGPGGKAAKVVWLLLFALGVTAIGGQLPEAARESALQRLPLPGAVILGLAVLAGLAWLLRLHAARVFAAIEIFAIFASPFLLMTVGQTLWTWKAYDPVRFAGSSLAPGTLAGPIVASPPGAARVVWIVLDELDQHAAFDARPASVDLPELDRLADISLVARNAFAPEGETRRSLASLLLGRQVVWAKPSDANRLPCIVAAANGSAESSDCWSAYPSIFEDLRSRGIASAVAGWYHPYCRVVAAALARCTWAGLAYWNSSRLSDSFDQQWHEVAKGIPILRDELRPGRRIRSEHERAYSTIWRAALEYVADPDAGFVLVHLPVPHHPDIYDPITETLSVEDSRSYFDNLALADRAVGELRGALERAGLWDRSSVVVTSDHWWRAIHRGDWGLTAEESAVYGEGSNRRIPFLLKLAGHTAHSTYTKPFNTLLLHDLTLALFDGRVATPTEVATWLDRTRGQAPVPYLTPHATRHRGGGKRPK